MTGNDVIAILADGTVIPIVVIAGYALLFRIPKGSRYDAYARIVMAGLTSYLFAKLLGSIYQPSDMRPFELMGLAPGASYLDNPGFPSDHALFTGFLTLAVWFETRSKYLAALLAILTVFVCVGRVIALVHTPLDVIGGLIVATVGAVWYVGVTERQVRPNTRQKHKKLVQ